MGTRGVNQSIFEHNLPMLLRQIQMIAFQSPVSPLYHVSIFVSQMQECALLVKDALVFAMRAYSPNEKPGLAQHILKATFAVLAASLKLCESVLTRRAGVKWTCFVIEHAPMASSFDSSEYD